MPEKKAMQRARKNKAEGKSPSTQAGEFVREEIHHIRQGRHGARNPRQAIAIGLSEARRAGVGLPPPKKGQAKPSTRRGAERDLEKGRGPGRSTSRKRSRAATERLKREPRSSASRKALSRQGSRAASRRTARDRSEAAKKGARTRARNARKRARS